MRSDGRDRGSPLGLGREWMRGPPRSFFHFCNFYFSPMLLWGGLWLFGGRILTSLGLACFGFFLAILILVGGGRW
ncbi:hypothetical protein BKA64DRAFT_672479 [Cadophora sp. MPI-SDFR-AT-0126]|nr:hypothetical protein BKA64DRAFT_672479 [Leotiomycetes sp. MPI-SDFR-AT-0126]